MFRSYGGEDSGSTEEYAQIQLRRSEWLDHTGYVTPEDVRRVQLAHPGPFDDITIDWVEDDEASPGAEPDAEQNEEIMPASPDVDNMGVDVDSLEILPEAVTRGPDKKKRRHYIKGGRYISKKAVAELWKQQLVAPVASGSGTSGRQIDKQGSMFQDKDAHIARLHEMIAELQGRYNQERGVNQQQYQGEVPSDQPAPRKPKRVSFHLETEGDQDMEEGNESEVEDKEEDSDHESLYE